MAVSAEIKQKLKNKIDGLPERSGVYIMYDADGTIIYIGKAVVLKNRVRQYFHNSQKLPKVEAMVDHIADFEYIITISELDALILEANLIKKHRPQYNILLKDDKSAPYIRIDLKKDFAPVEVTRRVRQDGAKYFGPYISGISIADVIEIIKSAYKIRSCTTFKRGARACLNYHIGLCSAPCEGNISAEEYREQIDKVCAFLTGKDDDASRLIRERMLDAADMEEFERALKYRDQLAVLERMKERIIVSLTTADDFDIFAYTCDDMLSAVSALFVRSGKLTGVKNFTVSGAHESGGEAIESFILQYYTGGEVPKEIYVSELPANPKVLSEYLSRNSGKRVEVKSAKKGQKAKLIDTALINAADYLEKSADRIKLKERMTSGAVDELKEIFGLSRRPKRIECFDISHISGTDKVASMVVGIEGEAEHKAYRRFKIRTVEGSDDFACMKEVLIRRFAKFSDGRFGDVPDLIVVDGGKGQLSYALEASAEAGADVRIIALAEREEEIYDKVSGEPVFVPKSSAALKLLIRLRDEAHRFAVSYHRTLRSKRYESELLSIEGVGKARAEKLLHHFKDIRLIKEASIEELAKVKGMDKAAAAGVYEYFRKEN